MIAQMPMPTHLNSSKEKPMKNTLFAVLALSVSVAFAANPGTVKIAHFKEVISPEVGA